MDVDEDDDEDNDKGEAGSAIGIADILIEDFATTQICRAVDGIDAVFQRRLKSATVALFRPLAPENSVSWPYR